MQISKKYSWVLPSLDFARKLKISGFVRNENHKDSDRVLVVMTIATLLVSLVFLPLRWVNDEYSLVLTNLAIAVSMCCVIISITSGRMIVARNLFASMIGIMMVVVVYIHGPFQLNWVFSGMAMLYFTMRSLPALIFTQTIGLLIAIILFGDLHMERWLQDIASLNITMALLFFGARTKEAYNDSLSKIAIDNERAANLDSLTSMRNRRSFDSSIDNIFSDIDSCTKKLSLMFIDIDHFKKINDTYGHDVGDKALVFMSKLLVECVRSEDAFRIGGEEFVVILDGFDVESSIKRADKIRKHIERNFVFECTVSGGVSKVKATVSIGVATYKDGDSIEDIMRKSDEALYSAKKLGRNRVESYVDNISGGNNDRKIH